MNSRSRSENAQRAASSFNNHDFDFGLGASLSRSSPASGSLNAQKQQNAAHTTFTSSVGGAGVAAGGGASWAQKPIPSSSSSVGGAGVAAGGGASWAQKPIPSSSSSSWSWSSSSLSSASSSASTWSWQSSSGGSLHAAPRSMVGDIMGKSWGSVDTSKVGTAKSGLVGGLSKGAAPDLFGDLVGAARLLSSAPMKKQQQRQGSKSSTFSNVEAMAASLPRGVPMKDAKAAKLNVADDMGAFVSVASATRANSSSQDDGWAAFEGLSSGLNSGFSRQANVSHSSFSKSQGGDPFGDFQGVPTSTTAASPATTTANVDPFAASSNANIDFSNDISKSAAATSDDFFNLASNVSAAAPPQTHAPEKADASGFFSTIGSDTLSFLNSRKTTASQLNGTTRTASDPFESVLGKISNLSARPKPEDSVMENLWSSTKTQPGLSTQNMPDDWGLETHFGGDDSATTTTELDGLPPPPAGVSASLAKDKGLENYKQGQFADAIKWLSWAEVLFEKHGESSRIIEVLTCRSSCLKEAGEYKKAVADCSKVIELDDGNTAVLLQRALLYESMEKYKLGIADLKDVLKREPQNRLANNTLSRLRKMGE